MTDSFRRSRAASGPSRRGVLKCMAYAGAGVLWTVAGGVPRALRMGSGDAWAATGDFTFVQISDSHIGFKGAANTDPPETLREALKKVAGLPQRPSLLLHTGDVSHLSKPEEFEMAAAIMKDAGIETHYIPGEHDAIGDDGKLFFERFGAKGTTGGWYSFDQGGVHFVALVNVVNLKPGGQGHLGNEQIEWLEEDLKARSASTPIVILAHMPLWSIYPEWGWGTDDSDAALAYLKRFGSVTVLNGHIHQVLQKVEGHVSYQTALSTAFPQPAPGQGKGPGPLKVEADKLRSVLGIRRIDFAHDRGTPAISDATLSA